MADMQEKFIRTLEHAIPDDAELVIDYEWGNVGVIRIMSKEGFHNYSTTRFKFDGARAEFTIKSPMTSDITVRVDDDRPEKFQEVIDAIMYPFS